MTQIYAFFQLLSGILTFISGYCVQVMVTLHTFQSILQPFLFGLCIWESPLNYDSKTNYQKIILTVALRILILIDFVRTYGYLPSTMGQYPQNTNSTERQSSLVSPQEKMYISQFCWLGSLFLCCSF